VSLSRGKCRHFNGMQNKCCAAGVNYREAFDGSRPGVFLRAACFEQDERPVHGRGTYIKAGEPSVLTPFDRRGEKAIPCAFREEPTDDEIQADRREADAWFDKSVAAIKVAGEWRVRPKPATDRREVVECPICKGRLHLSQSAYNGHVHGHCETEGCVSWME
jgi:hypothetical protein